MILQEEGIERFWFARITNQEEMENSLSFLRGAIEEILLAKGECKLELWVKQRFHQNIQHPILEVQFGD
jgi:hypothetical protein